MNRSRQSPAKHVVNALAEPTRAEPDTTSHRPVRVPVRLSPFLRARRVGGAGVGARLHPGVELDQRAADGDPCGSAARLAEALGDLRVALLILQPRDQGGA